MGALLVLVHALVTDILSLTSTIFSATTDRLTIHLYMFAFGRVQVVDGSTDG